MTHVSRFNAEVTSLVQRFEKKARSQTDRNLIYHLKNRLATVLSIDLSAVIAAAAPVLIEFSDKILAADKRERDEFFLNMDVKSEYTKRKNANVPDDDSHIFELTDMVKHYYKTCSAAEQEAIYLSVRKLLAESADYLLSIQAAH